MKDPHSQCKGLKIEKLRRGRKDSIIPRAVLRSEKEKGCFKSLSLSRSKIKES